MASAIEFVLGNFTLTFLILGFIAAAIAVARVPGGATFANVAEELLAYFILFSVSASFFYSFIFHVFFGELAAAFIGWADSPFQAEVGFASLGFAAVGLLAFRGDFRVRLAAILGPALFQWGAAIGHIMQIATTGNLAPGNAGIMLYTDIFLPLIGFALLWLKRQATMRTPQAAMVPRAISG
jgi:hypothetical protein